MFGHRCTGEPTGDMWPGSDTPTAEDARALLRRMNVMQQELDELARASSGLHEFVTVPKPERETYSWLDLVRLMRRHG